MSTMVNTEEVLKDCDKHAVEWCKEGQVEKLREIMVDIQIDGINKLDDEV